jgi:hypothetical protein
VHLYQLIGISVCSDFFSVFFYDNRFRLSAIENPGFTWHLFPSVAIWRER